MQRKRSWVLLASLNVGLIGCQASDPSPVVTTDAASEAVVEASPPCDLGGLCCCDSDVVDLPVCSAGKPVCLRGKTLRGGPDCGCLPDRYNPCCYPPYYSSDTGVRNDSDAGDGDAESDAGDDASPAADAGADGG